MQWAEVLQLAVEVPGRGLRLVRVAGELDRTSAPRLVSLIDKQFIALRAELGAEPGHVIIDLDGVRFFGVGGLEALIRVRDAGRRLAINLHLTGLSAREVLLPLRVTGLLGRFSTFATIEDALRGIPDPATVHAQAPSVTPARPRSVKMPPVAAAGGSRPGRTPPLGTAGRSHPGCAPDRRR